MICVSIKQCILFALILKKWVEFLGLFLFNYLFCFYLLFKSTGQFQSFF